LPSTARHIINNAAFQKQIYYKLKSIAADGYIHPTQNLQSRTVSLQSILLYVGHEIKQQTRKIDSEQYLVNSFASLYV